MNKATQLTNQINSLLQESNNPYLPIKKLDGTSAAEDNFGKPSSIPEPIRKIPALNDKNDHFYSSIHSDVKNNGPKLNQFHDHLKSFGSHLGSYDSRGNDVNFGDNHPNKVVSHYQLAGTHYLVDHKQGQTTNVSTSAYGQHHINNVIFK